MNSLTLLFRTVHGSHLYGINRPDSDLDIYEVYANRPKRKSRFIKQNIRDGVDVVRLDLSTFMLYADRGSHQALEAMFSPVAEVDVISDLRKSYRLNTNTLVHKYCDVIHSFMHMDGIKPKRHAVRIGWCLHDALEDGRFNPVLTALRRTYLLNASEQQLFDHAMNLMLE